MCLAVRIFGGERDQSGIKLPQNVYLTERSKYLCVCSTYIRKLSMKEKWHSRFKIGRRAHLAHPERTLNLHHSCIYQKRILTVAIYTGFLVHISQRKIREYYSRLQQNKFTFVLFYSYFCIACSSYVKYFLTHNLRFIYILI